MTVKYLLNLLTPRTFNLYGFPGAFMKQQPSQEKIILEGGLVVDDDGSGSGTPLTIFEIINHYDYDHIGYTNFATSSECSACKCQDCKDKHDGVINAINALTSSVKEMTSNKGVISSKRISYSYTPLEIKVDKRRRKEISKASLSIEKSKIATPLYLSCTFDQCTRAIGEQHELKKVDVTVEATAEQYNITVDNQSTASMEEEKVEHVSLRKWKNYPFKGFNILNGALKKLTIFINDYSEWIADGLLKHHAAGFSIPAGLPWHLVDEVYIPMNYGDEFHWVFIVVILKDRHIRVYDSMSGRRYFALSSKIQKLAKIFPTYLDISGFLN
ncbi:hypothetical protein CQW23_06048 [Capsicum baccatum]|uniref:Ubiquitin-like protease family profile domain-containing protein n=1 Tax=Capsicum baccatum TaxID=33114 RepID=A0A2G2X254_CAPBA|nr:hypothetical protein CQW23_06048 [Capsicum baccatum]